MTEDITAPATTIPKGFTAASDPPKVGKRVLAILTSGRVEFATFERITGNDPTVLYSFGYQVGGERVSVKCWRPIPSNWE